jgi:hypothetical protein
MQENLEVGTFSEGHPTFSWEDNDNKPLKYTHMPTLHRKFEKNITINETAWPRSQFQHCCICERFIYSHDLSAYFAVLRLRTDGREYINCSQIHNT